MVRAHGRRRRRRPRTQTTKTAERRRGTDYRGGRERGGATKRGDRGPAHARRAWERARSCPDNPSPSLSHCCARAVFRLAPRDGPSLGAASARRSVLLARVPRRRRSPSELPLLARNAFSLFLRRFVARTTHRRRESPITAERARSKALRARCYSSSRGAQYLGDRPNANKDNTRQRDYIVLVLRTHRTAT